MNTMTYKGYPARIEYSEEDGCFVGHIVGINDVVGFHGASVSELRAAFEEAVDDYMETCSKLGREFHPRFMQLWLPRPR
jgi:predicted HicB family RNase H-like nuclease